MGGSGLIYAAIAIMWAVVLIPMWLRNHDTAAENRSAERFGQAMRVLSRKEQAAADEGSDTVPAARESAPVPAQERRAPRVETAVTAPEARPAPRTSRPAARKSPRQRPRRSLAQRRARTLSVMVGLTLLLALVAAVTPVPWWAPLPVVTLMGAFVVHLRIQARQQQQRRSGQARRSAEPTAAPVSESEFERSASGFVSGPSRAVVVETKGVPAGADATADADEQGTFEAAAHEGDETWRPNPLPLPTYVTAPKAVRPIKVIDLTTPGAWSSGRLFDDGVSEEDLLAAEVADAELDALLAQEVAPPPVPEERDDADRRAVGD